MSTDTCGRHVRTTGEGPLVPNVLNYFEFSNGLRPAPRLPRKRRFPDAARKAHRSRALSWGLLSLLRKAFVETAVLAALSLASNSVSWDRQRRRVADAVRLSGYGAERTRDYPLVLARRPASSACSSATSVRAVGSPASLPGAVSAPRSSK
jgi:hypothetical protein